MYNSYSKYTQSKIYNISPKLFQNLEGIYTLLILE